MALVAVLIVVGGGYAAAALIGHVRANTRSAWIAGGNRALSRLAPVAGAIEGPTGNCHPSATQRCFYSAASVKGATATATAMFHAVGGSNIQARCDDLASVTATCIVSAQVPHSQLIATVFAHVDFIATKRLGHPVTHGSDIWFGVRDAPV